MAARNQVLRLAVVLGLITAVGPFAIDMYLPALPSIGRSLQASPAAVQMSLMAFFITIGACQLFYGPLADIIGRKLPIYGGLGIFVCGSIGCALAPTIEVLIAFRVVQAFGSCAGMVVPRAMVRDLYTGPEATRLMSLLMLVMSVSPILAPVSGSLVINLLGWRAVFWAVAVIGAFALTLAVFGLPETRPAHLRLDSNWSGALRSYRTLIVDPTFMSLALIGAFGIASFFVYLANSSFVIIDHFGLTPTQFSLCFALNAASFIGVSQFTGRLSARFGLARLMQFCVAALALVMTALAVLTLAGLDSLPVMIVMLMVGYGCLGLVLPTTAVLALDKHGAIAGTASALMGSVQMIIGASSMAITGLFAGGSPRPMLVGIAACALTAFAISQFVLRPLNARAARAQTG